MFFWKKYCRNQNTRLQVKQVTVPTSQRCTAPASFLHKHPQPWSNMFCTWKINYGHDLILLCRSAVQTIQDNAFVHKILISDSRRAQLIFLALLSPRGAPGCFDAAVIQSRNCFFTRLCQRKYTVSNAHAGAASYCIQYPYHIKTNSEFLSYNLQSTVVARHNRRHIR